MEFNASAQSFFVGSSVARGMFHLVMAVLELIILFKEWYFIDQPSVEASAMNRLLSMFCTVFTMLHIFSAGINFMIVALIRNRFEMLFMCFYFYTLIFFM